MGRSEWYLPPNQVRRTGSIQGDIQIGGKRPTSHSLFLFGLLRDTNADSIATKALCMRELPLERIDCHLPWFCGR